MRRIKSACLLQTIRFDTTNDANPDTDFESFCSKLDKKKTRYIIEDKKKEPDGSLIIKIKREHNSYKTDGYLD